MRLRSPRPLRAAIALGTLAVVAGLYACGTEPVGVDACRRVEKVRCESAQACKIVLSRPVHEGDSPEKNVAACIRYYNDQCEHGLVTTREPAPQAVDRCVEAIIAGSCDVVRTPELDVACAFLIPPNTPVAVSDAAADAADAAAD